MPLRLKYHWRPALQSVMEWTIILVAGILFLVGTIKLTVALVSMAIGGSAILGKLRGKLA